MRARVFLRSNQLRVEGASQGQLRANNLTTHKVFQLLFFFSFYIQVILLLFFFGRTWGELLQCLNFWSKSISEHGVPRFYTHIVNGQHNLDDAFDTCQ